MQFDDLLKFLQIVYKLREIILSCAEITHLDCRTSTKMTMSHKFLILHKYCNGLGENYFYKKLINDSLH